MPKRARRTAEQQAQDLQEKARQTIGRAARKEVESIMAAFPDSAHEFLKVAGEKGWRGDKPEAPKPQQPEAPKDGGLATFLSDAYYKVKSMSAGPICSLLSIAEPVACSKNALRGLVVAGNRVPSKTICLELFEFIFGHNPEWSATGDLRQLDTLHKYLCDRNAERGRRARDLVFPLDWERDGIYALSLRPVGDGQALDVTHKYTKQVNSFTDEDLNGAPLASVKVQHNFSETTAFLMSESCAMLHRILLLDFPEQTVATAGAQNQQPPVARRLAASFAALGDVVRPPALMDGNFWGSEPPTPATPARTVSSRSPRSTRGSQTGCSSDGLRRSTSGFSTPTPCKGGGESSARRSEASVVPPPPLGPTAVAACEAGASLPPAGGDILPAEPEEPEIAGEAAQQSTPIDGAAHGEDDMQESDGDAGHD